LPDRDLVRHFSRRASIHGTMEEEVPMRVRAIVARRRSWRLALVLSVLGGVTAAAILGACSSASSHGTGNDGGEADTSLDSPAAYDALGDALTDSRLDGSMDGSATVDGAPGDGGPSLDAGDCGIGPAGEPTELSCTGLYSDWATKTVSSDVKQFAPGYPLWSDGAQKTRWVYLPPGQTINTSDMDEWTFPVGTKFWKEFKLPIGDDSSTPVRIETRLLWKRSAGDWYRTTYRWSEDGQTSATELTNGELDANGDGYQIPSQLFCNTCHDGRKDGVLGFEAVSLASTQASGFDMQELLDAGLLTDPPDSSLVVPGDPTAAAALAWLHANCGTACHNRGSGEAQSTGFWTRLDVATLSSVKATDTYTTGWDVQTTSYRIPEAGTTYRFHACDLGASAAYYRASKRDGIDGTPPMTQMPPIDTHMVDDAGLAALAAWIDCGRPRPT
jgi:hypothetical protein